MVRLPQWINKSKVNCLSLNVHNPNAQYCEHHRQKWVPFSSAGTQQVQEQISSDITDGRITAGPRQGLSVWHSSLCLCISSATKNSVSWVNFSPLQRISVSLCAMCIIINTGLKYSTRIAITQWKRKIGPHDPIWCKKLHLLITSVWRIHGSDEVEWAFVQGLELYKNQNHIDCMHTLCKCPQILVVPLYNCMVHLQTLQDNNHLKRTSSAINTFYLRT